MNKLLINGKYFYYYKMFAEIYNNKSFLKEYNYFFTRVAKYRIYTLVVKRGDNINYYLVQGEPVLYAYHYIKIFCFTIIRSNLKEKYYHINQKYDNVNEIFLGSLNEPIEIFFILEKNTFDICLKYYKFKLRNYLKK